jgi:hypothetical protein
MPGAEDYDIVGTLNRALAHARDRSVRPINDGIAFTSNIKRHTSSIESWIRSAISPF